MILAAQRGEYVGKLIVLSLDESEKIIYDKEWICDFKKFLFKEIEKRYT